MPIDVSSVSETWMKDVFTDRGLYCGKVEDVECDLKRFRMRSLVVKAVKGSYLSEMLGRKKGIIIPYPMVRAIGDIVLIKHFAAPPAGDEEVPTEPPATE
ncbi:MAG: PRC-barrel domain-containing protein [Candidatus Aenigmarchaeota archaeon]|nr:PRC-barrel domain-containing protein [Candidatus Aenigmarchaeota archaeon]